MRQYLRDFKVKSVSKTLKKIDFKKLLLIALLMRLILLPLSFHSDLVTYGIWGRYAEEFGLRGFYDWLSFGTYARPDYPPLAMILFLVIRIIWQGLFAIFWKINVLISLFPSNFIPWFEDEGYRLLMKLPSVFADIGIGALIFNLLKKKIGLGKAKFTASLYLFNPAIIYLSATWGQLDAFVGFFALLATIQLLNKKYYKSVFNFFLSIMTKATMAPASIILLIRSVKQKVKPRTVVNLTLFIAVLLTIVGYIFIDKDFFYWTVNLYLGKIIKGAVTLPYINLNAFNFWGIVVGLERVVETTTFMGITLSMWGWSIAAVFILAIIYKYIKGADFFFTLLVFFYSIFMFMPRVHERYLYPVFLFFPLVLVKNSKMMRLFILSSILFLLNLYHWWWVPNIGFLANLLDFEIIERGLSLLNLMVFMLLLKKYLSGKYTKWIYQ